MKTFIQTGDIVEVIAPADVKSGDIVEVGKLVGIACTDALSGKPVNIKTSGCFTVKKVSAQAWTVGAPVYVAAGEATTTASTNTPMGHAMAIAANPSATGVVRLSV
jgi:predicted RecA/RadA family phage recombinase